MYFIKHFLSLVYTVYEYIFPWVNSSWLSWLNYSCSIMEVPIFRVLSLLNPWRASIVVQYIGLGGFIRKKYIYTYVYIHNGWFTMVEISCTNFKLMLVVLYFGLLVWHLYYLLLEWLNGIYISQLTPNGVAAKDGRIREGDRVLQVDNTSLRGIENMAAASILRNSGSSIRLLLSRHQGKPHMLSRGELLRVDMTMCCCCC